MMPPLNLLLLNLWQLLHQVRVLVLHCCLLSATASRCCP
jgi:hypothetical protein